MVGGGWPSVDNLTESSEGSTDVVLDVLALLVEDTE